MTSMRPLRGHRQEVGLMRAFFCVISILSLVVIPVDDARAAMQFTLWAAQFSYGTPSGTFAWNSTMFGFRFDEPLGPFVSLRSDLRYGSLANPSFTATSISGYSGSTWIADTAFRVGLRTGPVGFAAYGGYGGVFFYAKSPSAAGKVVFCNLFRPLGGGGTGGASRGVGLGGGCTLVTSPTAKAT